MSPLEIAILRTVLYADVFNFPLTAAEIHHFLIHDQPTTFEQITQMLEQSTLLRQQLVMQAGFVTCHAELITQRQRREQASRHLWPQAIRYATWLGRLPFVRMVALTGALAMHNAAANDDDLDYLVVTTANRVWLARAFAIVLVRVARARGIIVCPNYVLAEDALEQDRQDLFIAHEVTQMIPLAGHDLYRQFRAANTWTDEHLPNASTPFHAEADYQPGGLWTVGKRSLEWLLSGAVGNRLEQWEYRRKLRKFAAEMRDSGSAAQIDSSHVKGHFNDYGHPVLQQYARRLREHGIDSGTPVPATGD